MHPEDRLGDEPIVHLSYRYLHNTALSFSGWRSYIMILEYSIGGKFSARFRIGKHAAHHWLG